MWASGISHWAKRSHFPALLDPVGKRALFQMERACFFPKVQLQCSHQGGVATRFY